MRSLGDRVGTPPNRVSGASFEQRARAVAHGGLHGFSRGTVGRGVLAREQSRQFCGGWRPALSYRTPCARAGWGGTGIPAVGQHTVDGNAIVRPAAAGHPLVSTRGPVCPAIAHPWRAPVARPARAEPGVRVPSCGHANPIDVDRRRSLCRTRWQLDGDVALETWGRVIWRCPLSRRSSQETRC